MKVVALSADARQIVAHELRWGATVGGPHGVRSVLVFQLILGIVRLLFVGLLIEDKGIFVLLEALALLKARGAEFEARLIGCFNDASVEHRARAIVRRADLDHDIQFEGELQGNRLLQAYADADIFCFPSFFAAESFGLVCVEAMRASLPVVATDWRGIPEVVEHGRTGLIVPPRASGPLADALERLIDDPDLRAEFGRRGRERFLTHFTVERFCAARRNSSIKLCISASGA